MCKADFCKSDHLKVVWEDQHLMKFIEMSESFCDGSFRCFINLKFCKLDCFLNMGNTYN